MPLLCRLPEEWNKETGVLIVGTGFTGLAAAIEACDAGASVLLLEKGSMPGGNSIIAGGGVNAVDPERQMLKSIRDSVDLHFKHTFEGGDCVGDPEKIRFIVENALEICVNWLESIGIRWPESMVMGFGALWQRTHLPAKYKEYRRGAAIVHAELDQVRKRGISILLKHKVTRIIREKPLEGKVLGVEVEAEDQKLYFKAKRAVILASGGFAANLEMVVDYDRRLVNTPTTNYLGATGECIKMAQDIGADTIGMDYIQCVPRTVKPPFKGMFFMISSKESRAFPSLAYKIFVNKEGDRFVKEDGRRDEITFATGAQQLFEPVPTVRADTIDELEKELMIPKGRLAKTIEQYNSHCDAMHDLDFGKDPSVLIPCRTPPFEAETKAQARHYTMGGLKVQGKTGQVIDRWRKIIPRLYAAGEVTGGTHGTNRLGHNATPECIVFGRIVGKFAAAETLCE